MKCVERENREFASPREGGPPAASLPGRCPLVRPGAARESGTVFSPLPESKCAPPAGRECGWYRGRVAFRPQQGTEGFLFCSARKEKVSLMGKVFLAVLATLVLGFCGILLGLASDIPIPELGSVIAVAVMGGFLLYDNRKKS